MWANALNTVYILLVVLISIFGLHALIITALYLLHYREKYRPAKIPHPWPVVAVQLPIFNEQSVAERMIDSICALDYPGDRLVIQILDDSTDGTTDIARQCVAHYREQGVNIELLHRSERVGYKAGALSAALERTQAEFIAIFDADFIPPRDYLRRVIPFFYQDARTGMVQARWGHLNRESNLLTRVQALMLDGHHVIEQVARSRSNLLLNFNGTGGVWRAACIRESGGWQSDTMAEDVDLSYRAQMRGWRLVFLPDLIVPGEIPVSMTIFKKQQARWTFGHIQTFRKLIVRLWRSPGLTIWQRLGGTFHLSANFGQIAALLMFLLSLPLVLLHPRQSNSIGLISMAASGPTVLFAAAQIFGYRREGFRCRAGRLLLLPGLVVIAIGLTASNTLAVLDVFTGRKMVWNVTPKARANGRSAGSGPVPALVWFEICLSIYCAAGLSLALRSAPDLIPLTALGMVSYGLVGFLSLVESARPNKPGKVQVEMARQ